VRKYGYGIEAGGEEFNNSANELKLKNVDWFFDLN
jgi:hypothetical protein